MTLARLFAAIFLVTLFLMVCLDGCTVASSQKKASEPKKDGQQGQSETLEKHGTFQTGSGSTTIYVENPKREKSYEIKWQSSNLYQVGSQKMKGQMNQVSGTIYNKGLPQSTFSAESGNIDRPRNQLSLKGEVQFHSIIRQITVYCQQATLFQAKHLINASGDVRAKGKGWTFGSFPEVIMNEDLTNVATPDLYPSIAQNSSSSLRK